MYKKWWPVVLLCGFTGGAQAQETVYRCAGPPVLYTTSLTPTEAEDKGCRAIEGAPVEVCGLKNIKTGKIDNPCRPIDLTSPSPRTVTSGGAPAWKAKELSALERWRFERCQDEATKAPTEAGVRLQLRLCKERFGQQPPSQLP